MESLIWNDLCGFIKRHFFNGKINWSFLYCVYWLGKRVLLHWKEAICHLSITQLQIRWAKTKNPICCVFHAIVILVTSCCQPGQRGWPNQALNFKRLILDAGECVKPFSFLSQNLLVRTSCMVWQPASDKCSFFWGGIGLTKDRERSETVACARYYTYK